MTAPTHTYPTRRIPAGLLVSLCGVGLLGCTGEIDGANGSGPTGTGPLGVAGSGTELTGGASCATPAVQASPLRRLTRQEYNNTVRDLLGDATRPADRFVSEAAQSGFSNGAASALLSPSVVEDFESAAASLARAATSNLPGLLGCDPAVMGEDACAEDFIQRFGARAFRRPLAADELTDYRALYANNKLELGLGPALELVLRAVLQSPLFLYRIELGLAAPNKAGALRLSAYETATRLAYLITGSMPDEALFQAAAANQLVEAKDLRAQAERLLATEHGAHALSDFYAQWGQLANVPNLHKNDARFTPGVGRLLLEETTRFVDETLRHGDGRLETLFTSPVSYLNSELAAYYGVTGPSGAAFERFEFPPGQRTGLLTQASFMATFAHEAQPSPVLRGKFIMEQVLCSPLPAPPANANATLPAADPSKTARQQLTELTSVAPCVSCHGLLNPPGFAFEHFDALGRYRERDGSRDIDTSGDLLGPGDLSGHFENHEDLLRLLSASETVRACVVGKWFTYTHGRGEGATDACSLQQMNEVFAKSDGNVRELLLSVVQTPAFLYRSDPKGAQP